MNGYSFLRQRGEVVHGGRRAKRAIGALLAALIALFVLGVSAASGTGIAAGDGINAIGAASTADTPGAASVPTGIERAAVDAYGRLPLALVPTATHTAVASPDFQLTVSPSSQTLQPGSSVSFAIGVGSIGGFSAPVTLSVSGLPSGVSDQFSPNPVTPPGTSFLTLTAAANAPTGTFAFTITATGGGISHDATGSAKVDFGLVPVCYGKLRGVVTDAETGQPIADATVGGATTTADGSYSIDQVPLGENNSPVQFNLRAFKDPPTNAPLHVGSYWWADGSPVAVCDQTTEIDFALVPVHPGHVSGTIYEGNPDPADFSKVIPTSTRIEGAQVYVAAGVVALTDTVATDAGGHYGELTFRLDYNNSIISPRYLAVSGPDLPYRHGYWPTNVQFEVGPDQRIVQDVALVKKCTASISGQVIYGDTGLPAANIDLSGLADPWDADRTTTDAQGRFSIPEILIGYNNRPIPLRAETFTVPGYLGAAASSAPEAIGCGGHWDAGTLRLQPVASNFGAVEGHVYDRETGAPLADTQIALGFSGATTDSEGFYRLDRIDLGSNGSVDARIFAFHEAPDNPPPDYYYSEETVTVTAGSTAVHDFHLLRRRYGRLIGVVRDAITQAPLAGQVGRCFSENRFTTITADENGRYDTGQVLRLAYPNAPTDVSCQFAASGYWYKNVSPTIRADETTQQDVDLLPICHATITGKVVDANTQLPIQGASVGGGGVTATTDANGDYRLENVTVGYGNSPLEVAVTASAPGYHAETKTVTVFCGGTIIVNFGPATGHIVIVKRTIPAGSGQSFDFTANWGSVFPLKDGESRDSGPIAAGSGYSVSESLPEGWTQTGASCSDGSPVTNIDLSPSETVTCTFTNQQGGLPPATVAVTKSCPNGAAASGDRFQVTDNGRAVGDPLACGGSLDVSVAAGSAYAVDEQAAGTADLDNYTKQLSAGCSGTLAFGGSASCTITNTLKRPKVTVTKSCPSGAAASGDRFQVTDNGQAVGDPLACGGSLDVSVAAGSAYAVDEQAAGTANLDNYTKQLSAGCSGTLAFGGSASCTITNTLKPGTVSVRKTVSGSPLSSLLPANQQAFTFQLRQGASTTSAGTLLEQANTNVANGGVVNFTSKLTATSPYQLCEIVMPGWRTSLTAPFVLYNASGDNSTLCTHFNVAPAEAKSIAIDNQPPPGGLARTIGFWKNWASCASSSGNQKPVLDQTLAAAEPAGITIGTLALHGSTSTPNTARDCLKAVRLLNKSTVDAGKKMSSDAAFNLAAQLLAADLNVKARALTCPSAISAINDAQTLLAAVHFNGITHDKLTGAQATKANNLATTLDRYNNNLLC